MLFTMLGSGDAKKIKIKDPEDVVPILEDSNRGVTFLFIDLMSIGIYKDNKSWVHIRLEKLQEDRSQSVQLTIDSPRSGVLRSMY